MNTAGYVAETVVTNLTVPTTSDVIVVTSVHRWIVIHSRTSPSYQVDLNWNDYVTGFGDATSSDFWLGLERIHLLTTSASYRIRIEIQAAANGK